MPFYEYEWLIQDINDIRKKEEEERKRQEKEHNFYKPPKMPSAPKMPTIRIPRF